MSIVHALSQRSTLAGAARPPRSPALATCCDELCEMHFADSSQLLSHALARPAPRDLPARCAPRPRPRIERNRHPQCPRLADIHANVAVTPIAACTSADGSVDSDGLSANRRPLFASAFRPSRRPNHKHLRIAGAFTRRTLSSMAPMECGPGPHPHPSPDARAQQLRVSSPCAVPHGFLRRGRSTSIADTITHAPECGKVGVLHTRCRPVLRLDRACNPHAGCAEGDTY